VLSAKFSINSATLISTFTMVVFMLIQPLFGLLSDKIGRKPLLIGFGVLGAVTTVPILTMLSHTTNFWPAFALIMLALIIVSGYTSINAVVKAELFPVNVRALGVGLPYAVAVSLFGGTADLSQRQRYRVSSPKTLFLPHYAGYRHTFSAVS
jgi:MHS family alpha-ketoglutarate permease-like MFS transporter